MFIPTETEALIRAGAMCFMALGVLMVLSGVFLLLKQAMGKAVQSLANQAARLAQKGIAEDVAGLVGNARGLVDALTNLVRTSAGIGIFLIIFGFLMIGASVLVLFQLVSH